MRWYYCWNRKSHGERTAAAFTCTFSGDRPGMGVDEFSYNREAESEPSMSPAPGALRLPETIEDVREKASVYTVAVIDNANLCVRSSARKPDLDIAATRRELDGIRKTVRENLLQPARISDEEQFLRWRKLQIYALRISCGPGLIEAI